MAFAGPRNECHHLSELKLEVSLSVRPSVSLSPRTGVRYCIMTDLQKSTIEMFDLGVFELKFSLLLFNFVWCGF